MESHSRSVTKAITWRFLATLTTMIGVLIFSGEIQLALAVGAFDTIIKLLIYYGHERAWNAIPWGRQLAAKQ